MNFISSKIIYKNVDKIINDIFRQTKSEKSPPAVLKKQIFRKFLRIAEVK